jgi:hypothetical protein
LLRPAVADVRLRAPISYQRVSTRQRSKTVVNFIAEGESD